MMEAIIEKYKDLIIQIATPYNTGTGFYSSSLNLIVTCEHVVRDNKTVVIDSTRFSKQLTKVLFTDPKYDIAFLEAPSEADFPINKFEFEREVQNDDSILVMGQPFGLKYMAKRGSITNAHYQVSDADFFEHNAALHPINSGGPILNDQGDIVGVNTFIIKNGEEIGFSLPVKSVVETHNAFEKGNGKVGCKCYACLTIVFDDNPKGNTCPNCNSSISIPTLAKPYESTGIAHTVEELLEENGYSIALARRGPNNWEIHKGSAMINISYYEKSGLIIGDAYLCVIPPSHDSQALFEYLLRQNHELESLTFSVKGQDVLLSLMIYDRYLNGDTGRSLMKHLFECADKYDNILVEEYGANWKLRNI